MANITKNYTKEAQLDDKGVKIDDIYTIETIETKEQKSTERISGEEIKRKINLLEIDLEFAQRKVNFIQEQINYYKSITKTKETKQ